MKKKVKILILILVILVIVISMIYSAFKPLKTDTTKLEAKMVSLSFTEQGTFVGDSVVELYPLVPGKIDKVNVKLGQSVKAGDIICVINSDALAYQISQIRSTIRSIEAEEKNTLVANKEKIELQELVLAQGERELEAALESFEKAKVLYDEGAISKEDYEEIERFVETQRVSLASIKQELVILKNGNTEYYKALIQAQEASVAKLRSDIENCNVRTTTSGTITELAAKNANMASGVSPVAVVATGGEKTIQLYISTKDVASIKEGDGVDIVLKRRGGDLLFPGRIKHIDSVASVRPSALGVLESRVRVEVEPLMGEDNTSFGIGYYADVKFYLYKEGGKLTVPKSALFEDNGKDKVFAVKGGRAIEVEVTKGMELRTETVIEEGLMAGDVVISDANDKNIKNGKKVQ